MVPICWYNMKLNYNGISSQYGIRAKELLDLASVHKPIIKDHILFCEICSNVKHSVNLFITLKFMKHYISNAIPQAYLVIVCKGSTFFHITIHLNVSLHYLLVFEQLVSSLTLQFIFNING